ncbi:MAG TPA: hypothetical protein DD738_06000 [Ruminiclostridium sp.]|jgi:beta-lactam-binding protein with PASTA domain|nr:hypothetical protein [Ruminiclostridium sp.]
MLSQWFLSSHEIKIKLKGYCILLLIILILLAGALLIHKNISIKGNIVVPMVIGLDISEAKAELNSVGLGFTIIEGSTDVLEDYCICI